MKLDKQSQQKERERQIEDLRAHFDPYSSQTKLHDWIITIILLCSVGSSHIDGFNDNIVIVAIDVVLLAFVAFIWQGRQLVGDTVKRESEQLSAREMALRFKRDRKFHGHLSAALIIGLFLWGGFLTKTFFVVLAVAAHSIFIYWQASKNEKRARRLAAYQNDI